MNNRFKDTFSTYNKSLAKEDTEISGELGVYLNGTKLVEVPNRSGYVYVRLRNSLSEVIQAFNDQVSATYGLPVIIVRDGTKYRVKGRDVERYSDWGSQSSFTPIHANQHSFNPDGGGGGDLVWVYGKQMMPMAAIPSGTSGADGVVVNSYQYKKTNGTILNIGLTGTQSMAAWKPTNNQAVMGIVYVDPDVGNPVFTFNTGTFFSASITGTEEVVPYYPSVNNSSYLLIAGIRLVSGTTTIGWDNIYDLRQWMTPPGTGTPAGGGGAFDGYGVALYDDGAYVISGTAIDFVSDGINVDVSASGTRGRVYISGSNVAGGQPWFSAYDDGVFIGSGTSFSFDNNLNVSVTGTRVVVEIGSIITGTFITGSGGGASSYAIYQYQTASGTAGGSASNGSWQNYPLNTEAYDPDSFGVLTTGSAVTLQAGTYVARSHIQFFAALGRLRTRLYNVDDSSIEVLGHSVYNNSATVGFIAPLEGTFTIAAPKTIALQYICAAAKADNGLGVESNYDTNIFGTLEFEKII